MRNLEGKTALVTGASSGVGRAVAMRLAREGVRLAISARRTDALNRLADEIVAKGATARPVVVAADLSKRGDALRVGGAALSALRQIDLLVNNAGISMGGAQTVVGDDDMARGLFETNYWSALALTQLLVPPMVGRGVGAVVNVSSLVTMTPIPLNGHYASSKAALSLASETLRMELRGTGVHVLAVLLRPNAERCWSGCAPRRSIRTT
jgi:short-subunit dehydrogenase